MEYFSKTASEESFNEDFRVEGFRVSVQEGQMKE